MKAVLHFSLFSSFLTVCQRFTNCETRVIGKPTFLAFLLFTKRAQYVKTRSPFMSYALTFCYVTQEYNILNPYVTGELIAVRTRRRLLHRGKIS